MSNGFCMIDAITLPIHVVLVPLYILLSILDWINTFSAAGISS